MTNRTLCLHASSRARGTRQRGGNAEAGFRHSQDLLLLSAGVSTGRPARGGAEASPWEWRVRGSLEVGPGEPSAAENVTGSRLPPQWSEQARVSLGPVCVGVPPTAAVLLAMPRVPALGGNRAQSVRVHEAARPWPLVWRPAFHTEVHRHLGLGRR